MPISETSWHEGLCFLEAHGLNLVASLPISSLPDGQQKALAQRTGSSQQDACVLLVANAGPLFWRAMQSSTMESVEPVDAFTIRVVEECCQVHWGDCEREWLYPSDTFFPVSPLGILAGWHHPSPLGQGIHPDYGLWFAYRALLWVNQTLPIKKESPSLSPCDSCLDKPCIQTCPVNAVSSDDSLDISRCLSYRQQDESPCADRCWARLSCPVGKEFQYDMEQIQYHYKHSLRMIKNSPD